MLALFLLQDYNLQGQSYIMTPGQTITTCSGTFYDPGGPNDNYSDNMSVVQTFVSSDTNSCLQVTFSSIELESSFDRLTIFDGTSAIGAPLATLSGSDSNITITSFSGALTFKFSSDASVQKAGWTAYFSCTTCSDPPPPINICDSIEFHAFCVDENPYGVTFESGTSGNGSLLLGTSKYSCLYSSPNPAWYYMQISSPGDLLIYIEQVSDSGSGLDVDFVCWGPFAASSQNDFVDKLCHGDYFLDDISHGSHRPQNGNHENDMGNYPDGNVVDCSYSAQSTEWCFIPDAAVGEWYLLLITNYSGQAGFITFSPVEEYSFASTNCNLLAPISYNAPLCDGDTLVLTCENPLSGATYNWSGPNGWTAVTTVPSVSIPNVSTYQSGEYTLQITNSDTSVVPSHVDIWIQAIPQVTVTASSDTICDGNSVFLQAAGASTYQWSPSSATTSSITVTPTATTTYTVTGTASGCSSSATYQIAVVYSNAFDTSAVACESILWNGTYYYADTFLRDTLVNVHGCDSVLTVHLTVHHPEHTAVTVTAIDSYTWTSGNGETYTQSGTYYYSHDDGNGCTQVDTLHLTIHHSSNNEFADMACESYEWDGIVYTTSGDYTRHYQNIYGADSVVTLHLTVHHGTHNVENGTACESYVWHGTTFTSSGTYTYVYVNADGCASVDTLHLTIHHVDLIEFNSTACEEFEWNGVTYQESGDYTRTFTNVAGCDSVVTMHLTINHPVHTAVTVTASDSYTWTSGNGQTYTQSGTYYYSHEDGNGCTQVDTLHLTIHHSSSFDFTFTVCEFCEWDGVVYTTSGDYIRHYQDIYGADSAVTLHLTVRYGTHNVENETACESFVWHGATYTSSGTYTYAYENEQGCPSVDTLHLTLYHPEPTSVTVTAYDSYTWTSGDGHTYTQSGTYYYMHEVGPECVQVDTLHLTIHYSSSNDFGVTACEYYLWDGIVYTTSGDYTREYQNIYGADSVVTLHLIVHQGTHKSETETTCERFEWHDETYMESGTYTYAYENEYGCASTDTLHLTLYHPEPTSITVTAYDSYTWTSGDGHTYTQSGIHYYMHEDDNGCAQVDTLHLTIHYSSSNNFAATACESYEWDGQEYTASGDYTRHYQDIYGADSVVTLHLTVHQGTHKSETETTCERFEWHDETYMESGTYTYAYENEYGCASVDTLHLTILPADFTEFNWTACDEYEWNGVIYHESGDYTQTFTNTVRCDSIVTLHLTINPEVHTKFDTSACEEYIWNDTVYYLSGNYTQTFTNVDGCDSVVTLRLTIFNAANTAINITTYDSYTWVQGTSETYTMSGTYYYMHEDENRCPGVDTLYLTIYYSSAYDISAIACDSYEWDGVVYTASGDYTQSYLDVFGADSVVTLHLLVHNGTHNVESDTACVSFVWHGETYTASGTYTYDYVNAYGCASTDTLHLTIHSADISEFTATACETYSWNGETFTETGDYTRAFTNADGCDSVVTLHLIVHYPTHTAVSITTNDSYTWTDGNDSTYTVPGTYYYTHEDTNGCTQVDTLHLTLHYSSDYDFAATACESYEWNGQVYTTSGDYTRSYQDIYGADSVVTLHLTVHYGTHNVLIDTACESYAWHGETYTSSGEYTYAYENADGCASMDTLHLTIHSADVSEFTATACETYSWNGETFTETGDYTRAFTNADGCDSVVTLHLTVHYPTHTAVSITTNDSYTWTDGNDSTYTVSGTYYYTQEDTNGCTQVDTLHLTLHYSSAYEFYATACESYEWDSIVYTTSGDYTRSYLNIYGADSVVTLHLTIHHPMHTATSVTAYNSYTWINGNDSTYTVSGTYYYTHEDDNGCTQVDTLYLTLHYASAYEFYASACDSYEWDGQVYTASGDYTRSYLDLYGADSVVTLHLLVNYGTHNVETDTACVSYLWHGENYTVSGTYTYDYVNAYGCASTDTLHLTIHSSNLSEFEATACETYCWDGETFTESGDYTRTFTNADGCDSVVSLHLTIHYPMHSALSVTAYDSYTWINGNDSTYTVSGTYYYTHEDDNGCTQVDTLYLTLHYSSTYEFYASACDSYEWDGQVYTASGDYTRSYQDVYGADSVVTLHLLVNYGTHNVETDTACVSFLWHGESHTVSGTYTYDYVNAYGCASTDTLHLTVNQSYLEHDTLYLSENQLPYYYAAADTIIPNGAPTAFSFSYTLPAQSGCDSTIWVQTFVFMNYSSVFDTTVCEADLPLLWHNHTFTATSTITDSLVTSHGADSTLSYIVMVNTLSADVGNTTHINCFNENTGAADVTITGGIPPLSFLWTNESGTSVSTTTHLSDQPAGTYSFTVRDELGCFDSTTVTLNTLHGEMLAGEITGTQNLCIGDSLGWVNGTEATGDEACVYQWQISTNGIIWEEAPGVNDDRNYYFNSLINNDFKLKRAWISDNCGTLYSNILEVAVIDTALHIVSLTPDFCEEMVTELMVETVMSDYVWSTGEQSPTIIVTTPGYYTVTATQNGCFASAGYTVETCESHLYLPNAITPGQEDGLNDYFCIPEKARSSIALFEITIFNRWGEQVYYSTDKNFRWNGKVNDKIHHQNVYPYIIRYTDNEGRPYHITGTITVL